jgi:hypothetical protein
MSNYQKKKKKKSAKKEENKNKQTNKQKYMHGPQLFQNSSRRTPECWILHHLP